jgi:hypothetical protein
MTMVSPGASTGCRSSATVPRSELTKRFTGLVIPGAGRTKTWPRSSSFSMQELAGVARDSADPAALEADAGQLLLGDPGEDGLAVAGIHDLECRGIKAAAAAGRSAVRCFGAVIGAGLT